MALDCDGTDDYINHGNITAIDQASALTVMCWIYRDTSNGGDVRDGLWSKSTLAGTGPYIELDYVNAGGSLFYIGSAQFGSNTGNNWPAGSWQHLAMVFDGSGVGNAGRLVVYNNGSSLALSYTGTIPATLPNNNSTAVAVGRLINDGTFDGKIALVKVWTAALSAAQVVQEMNSYRPVYTTNLLLWSPYDDGTDARDYTGQGNNGSLNSAPVQVAGPPVSYGG